MSERTYLDENGGRSLTSRRGFLTGSAAALAGGALMAVPGAVFAKDNGDDEGKKHGVTDIEILNYALTLEHLEAVFYIQGLEKFGVGAFRNYFKNKEFEGEEVRRKFVVIREHEKTHVDTLQSVLGKKAVPRCEYNFKDTAFTSVGKFLAIAQLLENTGVSAYDGAIAYIKAAKLVTSGATIATVEARHASYLNLINGDNPFPAAFDVPVAPQKICNTVDAGFIVRCPKPYGPYEDLDELCNRLPNTVIK